MSMTDFDAGGGLPPGSFASGAQSTSPVTQAVDLGDSVLLIRMDGTMTSYPKGRGNIVVGGRLVDPQTGRVVADFTQPTAGGTPSQIVNGVLVNTQTGQVIADLRGQLGIPTDATEYGRGQDTIRNAISEASVTGTYKGAPTLGAQQLALQRGQAVGYVDGTPTLAREQFGEGQRQFDVRAAIDYYTELMNRAANPRNYMQSFFERRGLTAPPGSENFGNVAPGETSRSIGSLFDFAPRFFQNLGAFSPTGSTYGYGAARPQYPTATTASAPAATTSTVPAVPVATQAAPTLTNIQPQQDVNIPQNAVTTLAPIAKADPKTNTQPAQTVSLSDFAVKAAKEAGMSPEDWFKKNLASYAKGGVIPEPVVGMGMRSGQMYTFGEKGPEGVVPAEYLPKFLRERGGQGSYAIGGVIGFNEGLSGSSDPFMDQTGTGPNDPSNPYGSGYDPFNVTGPYAGTEFIGPTTPTGYGPVITPSAPSTTASPTPTVSPTSSPSPATSQPFSLSPEQKAAIDAEIARIAELNKASQSQPVTRPPLPVQQPLQQPQAPQQVAPSAPAPAQQVTPTAPSAPAGNQPAAAVTQPASPQLPAGLLPTVRDVSPAGTFGQTIGTSSAFAARPQFLPGEDTPLQSLLSAGMLPPFLSRIFGQAQGIHSVGTNQPQRFALPDDVPLVSRLGWLQMLPSERAAFESYLSAYGIPIEDYLAQVEKVSPTGPQARSPLFGNRLLPFFQ